jgi:hypothetical protein
VVVGDQAAAGVDLGILQRPGDVVDGADGHAGLLEQIHPFGRGSRAEHRAQVGDQRVPMLPPRAEVGIERCFAQPTTIQPSRVSKAWNGTIDRCADSLMRGGT